jgi:hypothetical protein
MKFRIPCHTCLRMATGLAMSSVGVVPACQTHCEVDRARFATRPTMFASQAKIPAWWRLVLQHEDRITGVPVERTLVIATLDPWVRCPKGWGEVDNVEDGYKLRAMAAS